MEASITEMPTQEQAPVEETEERDTQKYGEFLFTIFPEPKVVESPDKFWRDMPA